MITWKPSMSVGIAEIDEQHQEIIRRAGEFLESLADRSRQDTGILLSYLRHYCVTHFGAEEAWMRDSGYPGQVDHQEAHDAFIKRLMALSAGHEKRGGRGLQPSEVGAWIGDWLTSHVAGSDIALARHLRAHGLPARRDPKPTRPRARRAGPRPAKPRKRAPPRR
jgi:hemerythrin